MKLTMSLIDETLVQDPSTQAVKTRTKNHGIQLSSTCRWQRLVDTSMHFPMYMSSKTP